MNLEKEKKEVRIISLLLVTFLVFSIYLSFSSLTDTKVHIYVHTPDNSGSAKYIVYDGGKKLEEGTVTMINNIGTIKCCGSHLQVHVGDNVVSAKVAPSSVMVYAVSYFGLAFISLLYVVGYREYEEYDVYVALLFLFGIVIIGLIDMGLTTPTIFS